MLFKDLKEGMRFRLYSEDEPEQFTEGSISEVWRSNTNPENILVQFDDELGCFTYGKDEQRLHNFMERLEN